jgi:hypothetical protein
MPAVDPRALAVSAEITAGLAAEPEKWLDRLAQSLTGGLESDSQMVRAIHDWVTLNVSYDTASLMSESVGNEPAADVLRTRCSACRGYANLFGELCHRSGLDCVTIQGHARGAGFHPFGREAPSEPNHAWNAVRVGGRWRLVDATWDAGRYRTDAGYEQRYSTDYLFPDPAWLIHTHLPSDSNWQLLDQPVSALEFGNLPYLTVEFFRLGLRLRTRLGLVNQSSGVFSVELAVPDSVSAFCWLLTPDGSKTGRPIEGVRTSGSVVFSTAPPSAGDWVVVIFAKPGGLTGQYTGVASFGLRTASAPDR